MKKILFLMAIAISAATLASCSKLSTDEEIVLPEPVSETKSYDVAVNVIDEVGGIEEINITIFDDEGISITSSLVTEAQWSQGTVNLNAVSKRRPSYLQCPNAGDGRVYLTFESVATKAVTPVTLVLVKKL
jgi:hypothetical protein